MYLGHGSAGANGTRAGILTRWSHAPVRKALARPPGLGVLLSVVVFLGCGLHHLPVDISQYTGDGVISRVEFTPNQGVRVDFERFSLAAPYRKQFSLTGLPRHASGYNIGLVPELKTDELEQRPGALMKPSIGVLSFRVLDLAGQVVVDATSPLDELDWRWNEHEPFGSIFRGLDAGIANSLIAEAAFGKPPNAPATLQVEYEPGENRLDLQCHVRLTAGGFL